MSGDVEPRFHDVGPLERFSQRRGRTVTVDGVEVAVFRRGSRIWAIQDACPHMGASLAGGRLDGDSVVCHWHGWRFDLETGASDARAWACAAVYRVRVENGRVLLAPPPPRPAEADDPAAGDDEEWVVWDDDTHLRPRDPD